MTNELKEKILEGLENVILAKNYALEYEDYEKAIAKFLAIIDEGIEKEIFHWKQSEMDEIAEKF